MNHPKNTALIAAFRNVETTVKTLAADSASSAERALNAAIVNADITRGFEEYLALVDDYAEDVEVSTDVSPDLMADSLDEQHSEWSLELIGVTGRRVTEAWCVRRRWKQSRVVSEYHYAHRQDGEALSFDDLRIAAPSDPDTVKPS